MSECERFEPHFQPNVALAPIGAPSLPAGGGVPPPPSASSNVHPRRLNHHERRRSNNCASPGLEKIETLGISVKLEKPSTPGPETVTDVYEALHVCTTPGEHSQNEESPEERLDPVKHRDVQDPEEERERLPEVELPETEQEEEESSAAVTSSTVTMEPPPAEVGTCSHDSDSESINASVAAAAELEERLLALDIPQDVLTLVRTLSHENQRLRDRHRSNLREIARLRALLDLQKIQTPDDSYERNNLTNPSAADSTEMSEETDSTLQTVNKEIEPTLASASNN